jgi:hypothetical protein
VVDAAAATSTFAIARTRSAVSIGVLGLLTCGAFALLAGGFAFSDVPPAIRAGSLAFAAAMLVLGTWIGRRALGPWTRGEVRAQGDLLRIEHPDTFAEPLTVHRSAIRLAVVDAEGAGRLGDQAAVAPERDLGWTQLPYLTSHDDAAPNVALLFERPVPVPRVRHTRLHGPMPGEALAGLRLRLDDPEAFERRMAAWGRLREPGEADAAHADDLLGSWQGDTPRGERRPLWLARLARNGWLMVPAILVLPWLMPVPVVIGGILLYHRRASGAAMMAATAVAFWIALGPMR